MIWGPACRSRTEGGPACAERDRDRDCCDRGPDSRIFQQRDIILATHTARRSSHDGERGAPRGAKDKDICTLHAHSRLPVAPPAVPRPVCPPDAPYSLTPCRGV